MNSFKNLLSQKAKSLRKVIRSPMNDKNRFRFLTLALLGLLILLFLAGLLKTSLDLRTSSRILKSAIDKVEESAILVQRQDSLIRELWEMNQKLSEQIRQMDSANKVIQRNVDIGFRTANRHISDIRETLDKVTVPQIK